MKKKKGKNKGINFQTKTETNEWTKNTQSLTVWDQQWPMFTTDLWYLHCLGPATTITQIYDTATGPGTIKDQLVVELLFRTSNNGPDLQYLHAKSFLFLSLGVATIVIFIILLPLCIVSVSMPPAATPPLIERWWTWGLWRIQQSPSLLNTQRQKQLKNKPSSCCIHYSRQEPWPHVQLQSSVSQPVMCVRMSVPQTIMSSVTENLDMGCWTCAMTSVHVARMEARLTLTNTSAEMELKRSLNLSQLGLNKCC